MDTNLKVLKILSQSAPRSVSGADMARELGVSRNAVCKAVAVLKKEGWRIESATNRGYMLCPSDIMDPHEIKGLLVPHNSIEVEYLEETASTNDIARNLAAACAAEGTVVLAAAQTKGRGRKGRTFISPKGSGVYMSLILRPQFSAQKSLLITVAAAVAVARTIEQTCRTEAEIKWVNDVYCRGKKVCGILTEAVMNVETGGLDYAILGVGINVYEPQGGFCAEIKNIAGAAWQGEPCQGLRNLIVAQFIKEFMQIYSHIETADFMDEYRRRSNVIGRKITVWRGNEVFGAEAIDIDQNGGLIVRLENGETDILKSGEITIRRQK